MYGLSHFETRGSRHLVFEPILADCHFICDSLNGNKQCTSLTMRRYAVAGIMGKKVTFSASIMRLIEKPYHALRGKMVPSVPFLIKLWRPMMLLLPWFSKGISCTTSLPRLHLPELLGVVLCGRIRTFTTEWPLELMVHVLYCIVGCGKWSDFKGKPPSKSPTRLSGATQQVLLDLPLGRS